MTARPHFILALMLAVLGLALSWSLQPRTGREGVTIHHENGWTCRYQRVNHKTLTTCRRGEEYARMYGLRGDRLR